MVYSVVVFLSGSSMVIWFFSVEMFMLTFHSKLRFLKMLASKVISTPLLTMSPTLSR